VNKSKHAKKKSFLSLFDVFGLERQKPSIALIHQKYNKNLWLFG